MDIYYIDTIEQTLPPEGFEYTVNEYGARQQWKLPFEQVQSKYFKKLSDVSADLIGGAKEDAKHFYMSIKIVDSDDNVIAKQKIGTKQPVEVAPEPEPEPEEQG